ncbi:globin family protein [Salinisphaera sp. S4-8]|uniref:group I truncated hemoglobin n=1 Tax=Salinisphaera sp. S4-8 TaxID=633357 RepID=UPI003340A87D
MFARYRLIPVFLPLVILLGACLSGCQAHPAPDRSLYVALGERDGIAELTETLLLTIAADRRIAGDFRRVDIQRLHRMLTDYICAVADGPCQYTGDSMRDVHRGQQISSADFNALVEDLVLSMEERGLSTATQNRLLARLAPDRREIVDIAPPPTPELRQLILGDLPLYRYSAPRNARGL